jgi:hypothetical protein
MTIYSLSEYMTLTLNSLSTLLNLKRKRAFLTLSQASFTYGQKASLRDPRFQMRRFWVASARPPSS